MRRPFEEWIKNFSPRIEVLDLGCFPSMEQGIYGCLCVDGRERCSCQESHRVLVGGNVAAGDYWSIGQVARGDQRYTGKAEVRWDQRLDDYW